MSCFCIANLDLLPSLSIDASFNFSVTAQAAISLYEQINLGLDIELPEFALPYLDIFIGLDISALASITAMLQLEAQAMAALGVDLSADVSALATLTASIEARLSAIASLNLNLTGWLQLAQINSIALSLTAMFNACLGLDASVTATAAFNMVTTPASWGLNLPLISALLSLTAQLNVSLDADFMASLQVTADAVASAMANISSMHRRSPI